MPIKLRDIPRGRLTPDEVEALSNDTFDYADRERVSLREAERVTKENAKDTNTRASLLELSKWTDIDLDELPPYHGPGMGEVTVGQGDFSFTRKVSEIAKAAQRGAGSVLKLPGVAMKALGELEPTRAEIEGFAKSPNAIRRFQAKYLKSPIGRQARKMSDVLRRAGNKYIDAVNGMSLEESDQSRHAREQAFLEAPFYRTFAAAAESVPAYGTAVAATLTSGNPNIGLLVLGSTTTSSAYESYRQQGVDPDLAIIGATLEGSIEMLTEKIPMDMLMKGAGRPFLTRALRMGTSESFQELFALLGQNYVSAVVKDVDPENYATVLTAARQEWSTIHQGWQDAMGAGFLMGGGAASFAQGAEPIFATNEQMTERYGFVPRNTPELLSMVEQVKEKVKTIEKASKEVAKGAPVAAPVAEVTQKAVDVPVKAVEGVTEVIEQPSAVAADVEAKPVKEIAEPVVLDQPAGKEIGEGEEKPRGTSVSVMAQAIEDELVEENKNIHDEIPTFRAMNMKVQAEKALALIEEDVERAKRVAFYQEPAPPNLFPENVFSALRVYAKMSVDVDLIMDLAFNEDVVREHTIIGKRIKSLDTDQDYADPIRAIREVVEARAEEKVRRGEDMSALESKLRELQAELERTKRAAGAHVSTAERNYGKRNKLVTRNEYDTIIERRKQEAGDFAGRAGGVVYVPNPQDFTDIAKIGMFHLEAMGRDFTKWSHQMTKDFGDWVNPHLKGQYDKLIEEAKSKGLDIKESKRLTTKKKRLATGTRKIDEKLSKLDLTKTPRFEIELDEEGRRLQNEFDLAREKFKAAQAVANIITEEEVRIIAQLSKDTAERKTKMENSTRRKEGKPATKTEMEYGVALSMFLEFVNDMKAEANKRTMKEVIKNYLVNPVDFVSDMAGTMKAAKASLDNSFHGRQGLRTFYKGLTGPLLGDFESGKIWWKTFIKSWQAMWGTLKKTQVQRALFAEMVSDPDYDLLKKSGVALNVTEEEIPVDLPSRIPVLGILFRMGENAFVTSSR